MAHAGSFLDIVQTAGGDRRSYTAAKKIAGWVERRAIYHHTRFTGKREVDCLRAYTLEQDEEDGTWRTIQDGVDYDIDTYGWYDFLDFIAKYPTPYERCFSRCSQIKEELMQKAWHPDRVTKWLEQGEDVLDNIMGV